MNATELASKLKSLGLIFDVNLSLEFDDEIRMFHIEGNQVSVISDMFSNDGYQKLSEVTIEPPLTNAIGSNMATEVSVWNLPNFEIKLCAVNYFFGPPRTENWTTTYLTMTKLAES